MEDIFPEGLGMVTGSAMPRGLALLRNMPAAGVRVHVLGEEGVFGHLPVACGVARGLQAGRVGLPDEHAHVGVQVALLTVTVRRVAVEHRGRRCHSARVVTAQVKIAFFPTPMYLNRGCCGCRRGCRISPLSPGGLMMMVIMTMTIMMMTTTIMLCAAGLALTCDPQNNGPP